MSETKFTPSPWTYEDRGETRGSEIYAVVEGWSYNPARIASVVPFRMHEANARLIAAAPSMYEALKEIHDNSTDCECDHSDENCCAVSGALFCSRCTAAVALRKAVPDG